MVDREHRENPRFSVDQPAYIRRGDEEVAGVMRNLSLGGARLLAPLSEPARVGDELTLRFTLPTLDEPLEVRARVRWRLAHDASTIGVQFMTGFRARQTWALGRYLEMLHDPSERSGP